MTPLEITALSYLTQDPVFHINMIEPINRGSAHILYADPDGVFMQETCSSAYMLSLQNPTALNKILTMISSAELFVSHQASFQEQIKTHFSFQTVQACIQAAYMKKEPLESNIEASDSLQITLLGKKHFSFIHEHYQHFASPEYLEERICSNTFYGAFLDHQLTGFIGMHTEGSIGMLEVLPEYRRLGIASELEKFYINHLLQQEKIPFCQIMDGNSSSIKLQEKLGFSFADKPMYWFFN